MNIRQKILAGAAIMLLATTPAWSGSVNGNKVRGNDCQWNSCGGGNPKAPEIDAASGTSAIAPVNGIVL